MITACCCSCVRRYLSGIPTPCVMRIFSPDTACQTHETVLTGTGSPLVNGPAEFWTTCAATVPSPTDVVTAAAVGFVKCAQVGGKVVGRAEGVGMVVAQHPATTSQGVLVQ